MKDPDYIALDLCGYRYNKKYPPNKRQGVSNRGAARASLQTRKEAGPGGSLRHVRPASVRGKKRTRKAEFGKGGNKKPTLLLGAGRSVHSVILHLTTHFHLCPLQ